MSQNKIVSREDWLTARRALLEEEKEFNRFRDKLAEKRRALPWTKVEKPYVFAGAEGEESLTALFGSWNQLMVYHFMFDPEWLEGCKSCSLLADHYDPLVVHLRQRDVSLVTVSRAPLEKLQEFQARMGWSFPWLSSFESEFNHDFRVSFTSEEIASGAVDYNYCEQPFPLAEAPGLSVFYKNDQGDIFHTYSTYARGLEMLLGVYSFLDLAPKGRDEANLPYSMSWVRHHDRYGDDTFVDPYLPILGDEGSQH